MADNTLTVRPSAEATHLSHRLSPGQHLDQEMLAGSGPGVQLREIRFLTQTALRAAPDSEATESLHEVLGMPLPRAVGEVTGATDGRGPAVLWLGLDEFLVVGPDEADTGVSPEQVAGGLAVALGGRPGQVVDVSANRATLELSGPRARSVLQKSCQLDLHPRAFPVGRAVLTLLESTAVVLWRTGEDTWRLMPRASFTTHVVRWLLDGMREYA